PSPATAAVPERVGLTYLAYLDEARLLRIEIDFDLPAGGATGDRYRLSVAASTIGLIGGLLPMHISADAHGRAGESGVRPERYDGSPARPARARWRRTARRSTPGRRCAAAWRSS